MTAKAYITPMRAEDYRVTRLADVPIALVKEAPAIWRQVLDDGTLTSYLVTEYDKPNYNAPTATDIWLLDARQGDTINTIGERVQYPEAADNTAFGRDGYSLLEVGFVEPPSDGSNFYQSLDYFNSYSRDDTV